MQDSSDNQASLNDMDATMPALPSAQSSGLVPYQTQHVNDALLDAWYAQVPPTTYNMNKDSLLAMKRIPWNDGKYRSDLEDIVHVYIRNEDKVSNYFLLAIHLL